ncbi:hypothetical protein GWK47_005588 [Chionoecetes opilio]|uniref:Uncharacterized protein n=1 Tax=Chionoecetes opilio TaxID=41210 RepID=A0A8J4Y8D8_CHIOP|nr:hypothetical protein GWK47_005588 [Chionoecetes opilio]
MATDTKDAKNAPPASRYCYCVCDKKRRKHPGVRLQFSRKMLEAPLASAEIGLDVAAGEDSSTITPGKIWHTVFFLTLMLECCQNPQYSHSLPPHKPQPQPPTTKATATASPHIKSQPQQRDGTPIRSLLRNTIYGLRMRIQQMGREAVRAPHQLIATAANFLAPEGRFHQALPAAPGSASLPDIRGYMWSFGVENSSHSLSTSPPTKKPCASQVSRSDSPVETMAMIEEYLAQPQDMSPLPSSQTGSSSPPSFSTLKVLAEIHSLPSHLPPTPLPPPASQLPPCSPSSPSFSPLHPSSLPSDPPMSSPSSSTTSDRPAVKSFLNLPLPPGCTKDSLLSQPSPSLSPRPPDPTDCTSPTTLDPPPDITDPANPSIPAATITSPTTLDPPPDIADPANPSIPAATIPTIITR